MKIEHIKFNQEASRRVYNDYMKRVKKATNSLSKDNQDDIYMEINSHIFEAIQHKDQANEIDALLDILEKLGTPEEVLKPLVADKKLEQATRTFNPIHIFKALLLNISNGISYLIFFILYVLLLGFVILIYFKIKTPDEVGLFHSATGETVLGMSRGHYSTELLGNWFIPVMLLLIVVFYLLITVVLRIKRTIKKSIL